MYQKGKGKYDINSMFTINFHVFISTETIFGWHSRLISSYIGLDFFFFFFIRK